MNELSDHLCFHHRARAASARCPQCERFFCRECVTEHDGRVICAACLKLLLEGSRKSKHPALRQTMTMVLQAALGVVTCWLIFYILGQTLLRIPSRFHEGTLWHSERDKSDG